MCEAWGIQASVRAWLVNSRTSEGKLLQCMRLTSFALQTLDGLENNFNAFSVYSSRSSVGVSLLVGPSLDADVDVFAGDGGRLVVADVAVKSFKFRLVVFYAPIG